AVGLVLLILAAYLGWQQFGFGRNRDSAETLLSWAERAWTDGDVSASASAAREADATLQGGAAFLTPAALYNHAAGATGLFAPLPSATADLEAKVNVYLERERALASFRDALDSSSAREMAALLRETAPSADADPSLARAMERVVAVAAVERLKADSDSLTPEEARSRAAADRDILLPVLSGNAAAEFENELSSFADNQRVRLGGQIRREILAVAAAARAGDENALERYRTLAKRINQADVPELTGSPAEMAESEDRETLHQLADLASVVDEAEKSARTALSRPEAEGEETVVDTYVEQAKQIDAPNPAMADAAVAMVESTRALEDELLGLRVELFGRLQSEMRRNRDYPGTRMAWGMLRSAFDDPEIQVNPRGFRYDTSNARMEFLFRDIPSVMEMGQDDYEKRIRAEMAGYTFTTGWALLFHKPMVWMADLASSMRAANVNPHLHPTWEVLEGPGGPLALSLPGVASDSAVASPADAHGRFVFIENKLLPVTELPAPADEQRLVDDFLSAARALEETVMNDESIRQPLRQALRPVLMGTYQKPDPQDYFDSAFCRRLIEADYLETYINPMPDAIRQALDTYRQALGKIEAGYDEFSVDLGDGRHLFAVARLEADLTEGAASDQDPETGETMPRYTWRIERDESTVFYSPMPSRFVYSFMTAEHFSGRHRVRPAGVPDQTEVWHATRGRVGFYDDGAERAVGDDDVWNQAIAEDSSGRFDPTIGPPGWNFPFHIMQRDDQGDPVRLATLSGVVESPDFSSIVDDEARRAAEEEWLDHTAEVLSEPGELGLIFHQFFRYCSDSPLPELPNLIGSHFGLSDTHQTVYESLERRWVGRLIGDCDDLAEVFQVLTRRQGKLSHVMQLPGHAAAGYVEPIDGGGYRFVVLQTGPVMQFSAGTLNEVVEMAYRAFDRGDGISHMTTDAVPLLLRFADEETRTPFVLSARIYEDAEYADTMITVQSYWHEHVYSAALAVMEEMVAEDPEIGSIKELGSLYERVGEYDKSELMRRRELGMVEDNPQASLSTLLEITQLHFQDKNREKALQSLGEMETIMQRMIRQDDAPEFFRAMTFRSFWAMYLARLGQPDRAWTLLRYDATMTKRQLGRIAEPVLRTLVVLYDRMAMMRDAAGGTLSGDAKTAMDDVRRELEEAFGRGYFKGDDSYNTIINRYFVMGRFAVSDIGRQAGLASLLQDGPYASAPKDHTRRPRNIEDADWEWFRITPQLYLAFAMEMLDQDEYPELYDPAGARPLLEAVARSAEKGQGLGSDVAGSDDVVKAELTLSFLNNDLAAFRQAMVTVKEKDYSSLYDDAAMTFGLNCGLVPLADFPAWCEAFREFFPGSQHYFKVVYRAIDKEHYDHALVMAEATARFFPEHELLMKEAEFIRSIVPNLKMRKYNRSYSRAAQAPAEVKPAA
ncbi:MAG: hypothetical protein LUC93_06640, partial [Planctomycetaceae bacterium]|nr:hypothetical protein [Planctomycetaceae bacterium]